MIRILGFLILVCASLPSAGIAGDAGLPQGVGTAVAKLAANALLPSVTTEASVLTDPQGRTLYTLASDMEFGKSACNGDCAVNWPPFVAADGAVGQGDWNIFLRDDGQRQWAYKGKPLYTYAKDQARGDAKGHNVLEIWTAVRAGPSASAQAAR